MVLGNQIETYSGTAINPLDPKPEDIHIIDMAHSLSLTCRYTGHCRVFYSVAEHCIRVAEIVPQEYKLAALLHDAAEAYLSDIARPVKPFLPGYKEIEERLLSVILDVFDIHDVDWEVIKKADNILLVTEGRDLMPFGAVWDSWRIAEPQETPIEPMTIQGAELMFLHRFKKYGGKIR